MPVSGAEVVVEWRMTPGEWEDLRRILLTRPWSPYVEHLWHDGKLGPVPGDLMTGTWHSEAERCEALEAAIKVKEALIADLQVQLRDCHAQRRAAQIKWGLDYAQQRYGRPSEQEMIEKYGRCID